MIRRQCFFLILTCIVKLTYGQHDSIVRGYTQPFFPGGFDSLYVHLEDNFRISRLDHSFRQQEDLIADLRLTINSKGQVIQVSGGDSRIEYEMERAFRSLPPFTPAMNDGKAVTSYLELRFMFMLKGNQMEVIEHLGDVSTMQTRDGGWLKAVLIGSAVLVFLLLWGI
jgi:hypothetical protein